MGHTVAGQIGGTSIELFTQGLHLPVNAFACAGSICGPPDSKLQARLTLPALRPPSSGGH